MNREVWLNKRGNGGNLAKFNKTRERYIHVSAQAGMREVKDEITGVISKVPYIQKPGITMVKRSTVNRRERNIIKHNEKVYEDEAA